MNLSDYKEEKPHYLKRIVWYIVNHTLFRILIGTKFRFLRNAILSLFGTKVTKETYVYPSANIYAPWNLVLGRTCIGPRVFLYNKEPIIIGDDCVISQDSVICTASHNIASLMLPVKNKPITIANNVWVASYAFIGPGVTIGEGAVVGACACVFNNVEPWTVVGGNPAKFIKKRIIEQ
jgi:putative colanic acid biosynthesis acetyltransferase WcaF